MDLWSAANERARPVPPGQAGSFGSRRSQDSRPRFRSRSITNVASAFFELNPGERMDGRRAILVEGGRWLVFAPLSPVGFGLAFSRALARSFLRRQS